MTREGSPAPTRVLFVSSEFGTPRHRCEIPIEGLAKAGVDADLIRIEELGDSVLSGADTGRLTRYSHVVLNRVPLSPGVERMVDQLSRSETKVLFDVDDLLFDPELLARLPFVLRREPEARARLLEAAAGIRETMRRCCGVLCATSKLASEAAHLNRTVVVENCVSNRLVELSDAAVRDRPRDPPSATLGFLCGHEGHLLDLELIREPLSVLLRENPSLRLRFVGLVERAGPILEDLRDRIDLVPYVPWPVLPTQIAVMDVCLAPLVSDRFTECKSDLRYLEAALCGVPLVASPVGQTPESITDGVNGFLADGPGEWIDRVQVLLSDPERRREMGLAARRDVLTHRRAEQMGRAILEALKQQ
ncbi:MAG: glycosyltransferase family 4 protein [Acidobacteria bacterium]|nr:glycosyltransferase family 4 protein [Acidobacteriota bacterium]